MVVIIVNVGGKVGLGGGGGEEERRKSCGLWAVGRSKRGEERK